jgi:hypothetical protein
VSGKLQAPHHQQLNKIAQVQAGRCGVEPAVKSYGPRIEGIFELLLISRDVDKSSPDKFVVNGGERRIVALLAQPGTAGHVNNLAVS